MRILEFIPKDVKLNSWDDAAKYYEMLQNQEISSTDELEKWILKNSELKAWADEEMAWAYINMTCNTENKEYEDRYMKIVSEIMPNIEKAQFELDKKLTGSQYFDKLNDERYGELKKRLRNKMEIFREENIAITAEARTVASEFDKIAGSMMVDFEGKERTMQEMKKFIESDDRAIRKAAYMAVVKKRAIYRNDLNNIYDRLIELRFKKAENSGFDNYRDYAFRSMERFDYTPQDCHEFLNSVEKHVMPVYKMVLENQKAKLGIDSMKPWDVSGTPKGDRQLRPFERGNEMLEKVKKIFQRIRPKYREYLQKMDDNGFFDLESRKGKSPGGYNYPLSLSGMPFIFMNAVGVHQDVATMVHEGGHAIHTFLTRHEPLVEYQEAPSETAELASTAMEFITYDYLDEFYSSEADIKKAQRDHLEDCIKFLPWCMMIDDFQHWVYTHRGHTAAERNKYWYELSKKLQLKYIDFEGLEEHMKYAWQKQGHLFDVPFYYIEYAIAQLGALLVWKNFREDREKALDQYEAALALGSSKPIPQVYEAAGIKFDFSEENIKGLMEFVKAELEKLY